MPTITAVVITLDEERNIQRCLDSVVGVVDEIIVLDSFSKDNTKAICESYENLRFEQREWQGYSASKNYANSLATSDYILSLDADEALSEELRTAILEVKPRLHEAYRFARLTNYCGKWIRHSGWYPDFKVRLFPKNKATWEGDFVHETLKTDDIQIETLSGDLLHYSYYSIQEHYERVEKYSLLAAQKKFKQGKQGSLLKGFFSALNRFIKIYFFKAGFLDGVSGLTIARISAYAAWLRQKKLIQLNREKT